MRQKSAKDSGALLIVEHGRVSAPAVVGWQDQIIAMEASRGQTPI